LTPDEIRSARAARAGDIPAGTGRMHAFPAQLRATMVERDGKQFYEVDGYSTIWNRGYEMWDFCGPYMEVMRDTAFDESLAASPDVAFLVNHKGVTMARTTNGTLELGKDALGMRIHALLNPARQDVRDIVIAIDDKNVDQMSLAFMLNDGTWNEDFSEFSVTSADINRGDVSAVNYGANPYTSIAARAAEWLSSLDQMPEPVRRAALERLSRAGVPEVSPDASADRAETADEPAPAGHRAAFYAALAALAE
jgi:HK97 family phage prohead protease